MRSIVRRLVVLLTRVVKRGQRVNDEEVNDEENLVQRAPHHVQGGIKAGLSLLPMSLERVGGKIRLYSKGNLTLVRLHQTMVHMGCCGLALPKGNSWGLKHTQCWLVGTGIHGTLSAGNGITTE